MGRQWKIRFLPRDRFDGCVGECDDPTEGDEIRIAKGQDPIDELDTVIHEVLHASNFKTFSEEFVGELATDLAKILHALGYQRIANAQAKGR